MYSAQKFDSRPRDFCRLVSKDMETLKIHLNEDKNTSIGKAAFKKKVKLKVHEAALEYLLLEQKEHNKIKDIEYETLEIQPYFRT